MEKLKTLVELTGIERVTQIKFSCFFATENFFTCSMSDNLSTEE
jgi:hypothetical protein